MGRWQDDVRGVPVIPEPHPSPEAPPSAPGPDKAPAPPVHDNNTRPGPVNELRLGAADALSRALTLSRSHNGDAPVEGEVALWNDFVALAKLAKAGVHMRVLGVA